MNDQVPHSPLAAERHHRILTALANDGFVRSAHLVDELGVASVTLRRDLAQMEKEGLLMRVYGGAVPLEATGHDPLSPPQQSATGQATRLVGILVPSLNYYWPGVVKGIEAQAIELGFEIVLRGASYELQDERPLLQRLLESEEIVGLIVAPNPDTPYAGAVLEWLLDSRVPTVLVEREAIFPSTAEPAESVTTDHALGAALAARHFEELGHRRVGLVLSSNSPTSRKIAAGWHAECNDLGLQPHTHMEQMLPDRSSPNFSAVVGEALDQAVAKGITALLVHSDPDAMALVDLALSRGISVPGDLSIIAYDDEVAELFTPGLTAIRPPRFDVGRAAVDLLASRISHPGLATRRLTMSPTLNIRDSTAKPRP